MSPSLRPRPSHPALCAALAGALLVGAPSDGQAQEVDSSRYTVRPTFGLGVGMFAFLGDIGRGHKGYSPLVTRVGYELRAGTPLTPWLDVGLYALHGRVGANERSLVRNLNFESRITTGGLQFTYNFHQFLNPGRRVEPYVSLGFEAVEFLSKTDLYDAEGRPYHYWSDGTIRDRAESDVQAADAVQLQRDYSYESDIRELDLDGFGKYPELTWAIPVGIGARMHLGGRFDLRVGTTMHFTTTDLIDGVTVNSREERQGDARMDRFLYSSACLSYGLGQRKPRTQQGPVITPSEMDLLVLADDEDGDGVTDWNDQCPGTPAGITVDASGCPLDGDGDGVPDHLDLEPGSAPGAHVDASGVTLSDEALLQAFLAFKDSANTRIVRSRVESFGVRSTTVVRQRPRNYAVKVGDDVRGIPEDLMQRILSIPDLRTIEQGDTTIYLIGDHSTLPEALRRQLELRSKGMEGTVIAEENGRVINVDEEIRRAGGIPDTVAAAPAREEVVVRVQLGAYRNKLSRNIFTGIKDLLVIQGDDGLTRYYTGSYTDVNPAAKHRVDMLLKGFQGAFLVAFKNGQRVSLKDAGARLTGPEDLRSTPTGGIDKNLIRYRLQVGTFAGNVPMDIMDKFIEVGNVTPVPSVDAVRYYYGDYRSRLEADAAKEALKAKGLTDAFTVGAVGDRLIPAEEADRLLAEP